MSATDFDIIVIGAGPGGYVAAIRAAQLGQKVACVEKRATLGGTCLNVGCIPSKALLESSEQYANAKHHLDVHGISAKDVSLDLDKMYARKDTVVKNLTTGIEGLFKKNKVTWVKGAAKVVKSGEIDVEGKKYTAKHIILATGSEPVELPFMKFDQKQIICSTGALSLGRIPEHLVVVGGGVIGLELGSVYLRLGSKVTVVEFMDVVLPGMDKEVSKTMHKILKKQGMVFKLGHKVKSAETSKDLVKLEVEDKKGEIVTVEGDCVLVSVGRRAYTAGLGLDDLGIQTERGKIVIDSHFKTSLEGVYAIGDIVDGPMLAHKAEEEGVACVEMIVNGHGHINYNDIPGIVYTYPEVATVGLTEEECKENSLPVKVGKYPYIANPRARCIDEKDGFVKVIAHAETDRVLGVHMIGPAVSELIAEAVLAMSFKASAEDIARVCHGHPSFAEAFKEAALGVDGKALHI